jgi:hypothetical protein
MPANAPKKRPFDLARIKARGKHEEDAAEYARLGMTNAEIGRLMNVAERTVRSYLKGAKDRGISLDPAPAEPVDKPKPSARRKPPRKRKSPRSFKRKNQGGGRVLTPFTVGGPGSATRARSSA